MSFAGAAKSSMMAVVPFAIAFWMFYPVSDRVAKPRSAGNAGSNKLTLKSGSVTKTKVEVVNETEEPICVRYCRSSCECLTADIPAAGVKIPPRSSEYVDAIFDLLGDPLNHRGFAPRLEFFGDGISLPLIASFDVEVVIP